MTAYYEESDGVGVIALNAPNTRNALDDRVLRDLTDAVAQARDSTTARVVIVHGLPGAFCSGADVVTVLGKKRPSVRTTRDDLSVVYRTILDLHDLPVPTIAAVDGPAVGAGVNLALACDLIIASPRAVLSFSFTRIGIHPGGGCTYFLAAALGYRRAMGLLLTAADLTAEQADDLGLLWQRADDPVAAARELASTLAARPSEVLADVKATVRRAAPGAPHDIAEVEAWAQAASLGEPAFTEFLSRFGRRKEAR